MTRSVNNFYSTDETGAIIPLAEISVNFAGGAEAPIYTTASGGIPAVQPLIATTSGKSTFYVEPGVYDIESKDPSTLTTSTFSNEEIGTSRELLGNSNVSEDIETILINDLSQTYIFDTVALFKASLIEFPDGKTIHLNDRDADFIKVTGTGSGNDLDIISSTSVNQSIGIVWLSSYDIRQLGFVVGSPVSDAGLFIQRAIDNDFYKTTETLIPDGDVYWGTTVMFHGKPAKLRGKGKQRTKIIPTSNLLFDTSRLPMVVDLPLEYAVNSLIISTRYNSENTSSTSTQRDLDIGDFSYNADGTGFERLAHIVFSGGQSFAKVTNIYHTAASYCYFAKAISDSSSRHFYIDFTGLRMQDSVGNIGSDWNNSISTTFGTTWNIASCAGGKPRGIAYRLHGILYSNVYNSSFDNIYKGFYGWDVRDSNVTFTGAGAESRLEHNGDVNIGGGLIRSVDSNVVVNGGSWIGGDVLGVGATHTIADFDDGSGNITESLIKCVSESNNGSQIIWNGGAPDIRSDTGTADRYPLIAVGNRALFKASTAFNNWQADDVIATNQAKVHVIDIEGNITIKTDSNKRLISIDNIVTTHSNQYVASGGDTTSNFDLFLEAANGNLMNEIYYRFNLSALALPDYTVINWPTTGAEFGLARFIQAGIYGFIEVQQNNGDLWRSTTADGGSTFSAWRQLNN